MNNHNTSLWKKKGVRHAAWFILLLIPAFLPLFRSGFIVSHDGRFHVYRVAALAQAWGEGVLHPRLFPEFGFDYGYTVLNFYSPLSYWPAAILTLFGIDPASATKLAAAFAFLLAAGAMYGYVRYLWGPKTGLVAAVLYTYFPYHLIDVYVRGAFPEHFAFVFPPLILWAYTVAFRQKRFLPALLWGALAWAGLVLTHNLTTVLMIPVFIAYVLLLAAKSGHWRRLAAVVGSLLLAVGMSAVYWLPVLVESNSVGISLGPSKGYENHLLNLGELIEQSIFFRYFDAEGLSLVFPLNWFSVGILMLATLVLLWNWRRKKTASTPYISLFHIALAWLSIFMITTSSLFLWHPLTDILGHLQYPWRFLALTAVGLAVGVSGITPMLSDKRSTVFLGFIFAISVLVAFPNLPVEMFDFPASDTWQPQRMWDEDAAVGHVGATWTGEFLPLTVKEQRWALGRQREGATDSPPLSPSPNVTLTEVSYDGMAVQIDTTEPIQLRLHQFHLPGWNAHIDGQPVATYPTDEMGLLTLDVPAGEHTVFLDFGHTPARTIGAWVSAFSALIWALLAWRHGKKERKLRIAALTLVLLTAILSINSLGIGKNVHTPNPIQIQLDDAALLLASEAQIARVDDTLEVSIYWLALREMATNYHVFIHLLDGAGQIVAQQDGDPVGGYSPTTRWRSGEIIRDRRYIPLPQGLPPGIYTIKAGLYEVSDTPRNLTTHPPQLDDRVDLGTIELP